MNNFLGNIKYLNFFFNFMNSKNNRNKIFAHNLNLKALPPHLKKPNIEINSDENFSQKEKIAPLKKKITKDFKPKLSDLDEQINDENQNINIFPENISTSAENLFENFIDGRNNYLNLIPHSDVYHKKLLSFDLNDQQLINSFKESNFINNTLSVSPVYYFTYKNYGKTCKWSPKNVERIDSKLFNKIQNSETRKSGKEIKTIKL